MHETVFKNERGKVNFQGLQSIGKGDEELIFIFYFQYCLSGHPTLPCNVLKFKSTTIMLDCGLDMTSTLNFLPLPLVQRYVLQPVSN